MPQTREMRELVTLTALRAARTARSQGLHLATIRWSGLAADGLARSVTGVTVSAVTGRQGGVQLVCSRHGLIGGVGSPVRLEDTVPDQVGQLGTPGFAPLDMAVQAFVALTNSPWPPMLHASDFTWNFNAGSSEEPDCSRRSGASASAGGPAQ